MLTSSARIVLRSLEPKDQCALSLTSRTSLSSFKYVLARKMWYRNGASHCDQSSHCDHIRRMTLNYKSFCDVPVHQRQLLTALQLVDPTTSISESCFANLDNLVSLQLDVASNDGRKVIELPDNLLTLRLAFDSLYHVFKLPYSLTYFEITRHAHLQSRLHLPTFNLVDFENLKVLLFGNGCNVGKLELPSNLVQLRLPDLQSAIVAFPDSLQILDMGRYDFSVDVLPSSLREWDTGSKWNHVLPKIPPTLESLTLSPLFSHSLDLLPPSLKLLRFRNYPDYMKFIFSNHPLRHIARLIK